MKPTTAGMTSEKPTMSDYMPVWLLDRIHHINEQLKEYGVKLEVREILPKADDE